MKDSISSVQAAGVQLARLSGPHGYCLNGDMVHLNAMFALLDAAAHERAWALQLWACPSAPSGAADLTGHIVAEVMLPPMGELADEIEHFDVSTFAWPPAGAGEHIMVLVLASGRPGQFNDIHDLAVYSRPQQFAQPQLVGNTGYRVEGARVQIWAGAVENPREANNRSGTLSVELWALPSAYTGGRFEGQRLAGGEIGTVNSQAALDLSPINLDFIAPPPGTWQIVLMLREWTALGNVTRDYVNFSIPYVTAPPVVEETLRTVAPAVEKSALMVIEKTVAPVAQAAPAPVIAKPAAPAVVKAVVGDLTKAPAVKPAKAAPKDGRISVNTAVLADLAEVEGLTLKLAQAIVKKRPFASLEDLRTVKGLGPKTLAKIRARLRL